MQKMSTGFSALSCSSYGVIKTFAKEPFLHGERIAHQFYNHTDETVDILMVSENLPYEVCYYPDSDK
jgi:hypothetical protein